MPSIVPVVREVVDRVKERCGQLRRKDNVWRVLKQSGADLFWEDFPSSFESDVAVLGDGSRFFRSAVQKLLKAATKTPVAPAPPAPKEKPLPFIRQKIMSSVRSSYMPSSLVPVKVGSLVAVHLTKARCEELKLPLAFVDYVPLIAKVRNVLDSHTFECAWLEAQGVHGEPCPDGLTDGYGGSWKDWSPDGKAQPTSLLKSQDIYSANFQLTPNTSQLCVPLRAALKTALFQRKQA